MRVLLLGLLVLWTALLLVWLVLHWGILPHIDQWRGTIEQRASSVLGIEVQIGRIEVRSSGWIPSLEMKQVVLLDAEKRPALVLPRVVAALAPHSLLALDLRFRQLFIEGAQLEVRRDRSGRILVAGFDLDQPGGADDRAALRWFLKQPEFVIRGGSLRWIDEQRAAPPLELTDILLVMRNGLRRHAMQLDATPPAGWGERFSLRGRFRQPLLDGDDLQHWTGTAFADLPRADVRQLQHYVTLPFSVSEGDGAVRAWIDLTRGVATSATVDVALRAVRAQLGDRLQQLALEQVEGRLLVSSQGDRYAVEARQLGFRTGDGLNWPAGDIKVGWRKPADGPTEGGQLSAQHLDLDVMSRIATSLPIGEPVRKLLAETRPQGTVKGFELSFTGEPDEPSAYQLSGQIDSLALDARASAHRDGIGRPGLGNAGLTFKASDKGGEAQLRIRGGAMEFPGVFDEPVVPFDELGAQISWRIDAAKRKNAAPQISVAVKSMQFSNADAQGSLDASWTTGPGEGTARNGRYPGRLQLEGHLSRGDGARVARYLPRQIDSEVRDYVRHSVKNGKIGRTDFRVNGDLWDFPYPQAGRRDSGEFRIAGQVEGLDFAYMPNWPASGTEPAIESPWPPMTQLKGELIFDRVSMEIRNASARIGKVQLDPVRARIANLADASTLQIDGRGKGPAGEMLKFVNTTPVGEWLGDSLRQSTIGGDADLRLALEMPLFDTSKTTVKGSIELAGNDLRIQPDTLALSNARGRVDFSEHGFQVSGATARLLGGEASFEGGSQSDGTVRFSGSGVASAEGLRRAVEPGTLFRAARLLSGQVAYKVNLGFARGHSEVNVTSNLVGIAADLPAPLRKSAETALPLRYQTSLLPAGAGQPVRERVRLELGTLLQAQFLHEYPPQGDDAARPAQPRVISGGIGINEPAPTPQAGVAASLNLGTVDADAWQEVLAKIGEPSSGDSGGDAAGSYAPSSIALRAQLLEIGERKFNGLVAGLSNDNGNWRANLEARQLSGYAEYRPARSGPGASAAGRVYARLSRLSLPRQEAEQVENLLDQQPANVPSLDIVVDEFELRGKRLGRIEIEATNRNEGNEAGRVREWRLTRLNMINPDARLTASGSWGGGGGPGTPRRSEIDFKLDLVDSGDLLERLQIGRAIRDGKGQLAGRIGWQGSPFSIDYKSLRGQFKVVIESGQFLNAEPGAARLLSVLSLQALPRRLALDFRDVFQKGFAFDSITGDVAISQGVARTNNLLMRGTQAAVLMEGKADIEREAQDIRVIVVPEINVGNAALAYAVINPAVGLGAFLAQLVLRKPLVQAGTREFHVSGNWDDPKVERVERKLSDPLPDLEPAPLPSAAEAMTPPAANGPAGGQVVR